MSALTAWLTTHPDFLDGDRPDLIILANDDEGNSTGEPLERWVLGAPLDTDDEVSALEEAAARLETEGFALTGQWASVPTGCVINVERV